jgi:hypothetical protein
MMGSSDNQTAIMLMRRTAASADAGQTEACEANSSALFEFQPNAMLLKPFVN